MKLPNDTLYTTKNNIIGRMNRIFSGDPYPGDYSETIENKHQLYSLAFSESRTAMDNPPFYGWCVSNVDANVSGMSMVDYRRVYPG